MVKEVAIPVCCLPGGTAEAQGELPWTCKVLLSVEGFELEMEEAHKPSCRITGLGSGADLKLGFSHIAWPIVKFKILDSWHCSSMCFCGPFISPSTLVILLVYHQCLQTLGRLKGNHLLPSKFSDVGVSQPSLKIRKGKTLVK